MFTKATVLASLVAAAVAAPAPQVSQVSDGQLQAPAATMMATPVRQATDGQLQNVAATSASAAAKASSAASAGTTQSYTPLPYSYNQMPTLQTSLLAKVTSIAGLPAASIPGASVPAPPRVSSQVTGVTSHGPYSGPPATITGAVSNKAAGTAIPILPVNPKELGYNPNSELNAQEPVPFTPAGGLGTNGTEPLYQVQSDFDYESILLGLYQEWIELDLFHNIRASFTDEEFDAVGIDASGRFLIEFMADQESGHATLLSSLLGGPGGATPQCTYNYPYTTVHEAFDFAQKLTRFGESGVWGFQAHLDAREVAQLLDQSIATEARQQMIFRQFSGLFPMPVWFETGIPQSWQWTLLAPYISSCPANSKRLAWQNFPALTVLNQPSTSRTNASNTGFNEVTGFGPAAPSSDAAAIEAGEYCVGNGTVGYDCSAGISQNRTIPLSFAGRNLFLEWENPGKLVGPNNSYITTTSAGTPAYVAWVNQLNFTTTPLFNISTKNGMNYGNTIQPDMYVYGDDGVVNGTTFIALVDNAQFYSPFNLSGINTHVVAGPALYQSG